MKRTDRTAVCAFALLMGAFLLTGCKIGEPEAVSIVYTNDVHSYIDNESSGEDSEESGGLRYSQVAAMVQDKKDDGENVILVDAGDEIQGDIYGAMDQGEHIFDLMNAVGYDLATPGNHDFDYGVDRLNELLEKAEYPYISCNYRDAQTGKTVLSSTKIFNFSGTKVAFVGITTPEVYSSSTPAFFQNEQGQFIYSFDGYEKPEDLYDDVQEAVDSVRKKADYVIALAHVGVSVDEKNAGISAEDIIANTEGLDAFISAHSHTEIVSRNVKDKSGSDVVLTQTGSYLQSVGVMNISADGQITCELVQEYDGVDEKVAEIEDEWIDEVDGKMNEQIAVLDSTLYINDPDDTSKRLIRSTEMNLGDMTADSIYWFFNERLGLDCDVVIQNAGGIRAQIKAGDVSYYDVKQVCPFGDMVCLISASGQEIIDALEMGAANVGDWDDEQGIPAENGGFIQTAGLSYTIDASVPSTVSVGKTGLFKGVSGKYRVKDVMVYNRESGEYEPIDPDREYQLGGINYLLRESGNGLCMFADDDMTVDYVGQDYVILAEYMKAFETDGGYPSVNTAGSPLAAYDGYLLDYEDPYGAGRITILNADYPD